MVSVIDSCDHLSVLCFHDVTVVLVNTVQQWCRSCVDDTLQCWGTVPVKIGLDFMPVVAIQQLLFSCIALVV